MSPLGVLEVVALGSVLFLTFYATMNLLIALAFRRAPPITHHPNPHKVVVLVPVRDDPSIFNSHPYLVAMDYPDYHVVICDDSRDPGFSHHLEVLQDDRTRILRREEHVGRKSGALNFALDEIARLQPKYVVIFDADHRPPANFLNLAVAAIETDDVVCACGYQRHDMGAKGLFGRFYRACHAAGIVNFLGRNPLGIPTIFGGAAIFDYAWLRAKKFDPTSITEDCELSCRGYLDGDFRIAIRDDLFVHAAIPRGVHWFITQQ